MMTIQRPFSRPILAITSINIEGLSAEKEALLANMCEHQKCDILVIQETHRGLKRNRPKIRGMKLVLERPHDQYGSAVFVRPELSVISTALTYNNDIEILTVGLRSCTVTSYYKPPDTDFAFYEPANYQEQRIKIVIGDFNCHSVNWGYSDTDKNGEELENWAERTKLKIIHEPKLPPSFNSGRWKRGYNPDNIFVSEVITQQIIKHVEDPIPRTQHRAITCRITAVVQPEIVPFRRRFNFKRARWQPFAQDLDREIIKLRPEVGSYESFVQLVKTISCKHIPRGCRTNYIAGLNGSSLSVLERYRQLYEDDPFAEQTIQVGEELLNSIAASRRERWCEMMEQLDMKQNSRRAWKLLKNLSNDPTTPKCKQGNVSPDQIANKVLLDGKTTRRGKVKRMTIERDLENEKHLLRDPFIMEELRNAIHQMKNRKAAGPDEIRTEQIKQFGTETNRWILGLMNHCIRTSQIPRLWRRARVVALLKPGKQPDNAANFRPISLLCHLFKILERMVLNRISCSIDKLLIPEQAGFRPGKSCTGQILHLTQHIEDGYERKQITGVVFIDLSAAYDTINHRRLLFKTYEITRDYGLVKFIECILQNRRFYVTLGDKNSRWRPQKNGLAQGSVLAPILYNIYTNDLPTDPKVKRFIYADDTAIAAQGYNFQEVEDMLKKYLEKIDVYYDLNCLRPNPSKTKVCAFHLRNRYAGRKLQIQWRQKELEHCDTPKYLGVKLDRTLTFSTHCQETKQKVCTRNNIIRRLTGTSWGAQPSVLRTSAMALCLSAAEYAAPVWRNSVHAKKVDTAVNEMGRIVSGCLKPTPIEKIYPIIGIAPPSVRRMVAAEIERQKQTIDPRHPMFGFNVQKARLKSRKSFLQTTKPLTIAPDQRRIGLWRQRVPDPLLELREELSAGCQLPYPIWKSLNRLRTGVSRCKTNLAKWGYLRGAAICECGTTVQNEEHLLVCPDLPAACTLEDALLANVRAVLVADHWKGSI